MGRPVAALLALLLLPLRVVSFAAASARWLGRQAAAKADAKASPTASVRLPAVPGRWVEAPGTFMRDEVPDDGLQKWVAWCEMAAPEGLAAAEGQQAAEGLAREGVGTESLGERQERRAGLQRAHVAWERAAMLRSMVAQAAAGEDPCEEEDRPVEERQCPRVLWDQALHTDGALRPTGMLLCGAAPSLAAFRALIKADPYAEAGVFAWTSIFKWTQVRTLVA
jgi:hypothetical protein